MIPKIIHQIWIGEEPPEYIVNGMNTVKNMNPDFKYIKWDNENILDLNLSKKAIGWLNDPTVITSFLADHLRHVILMKYGGWYIDADTICNESILELHNKVCYNDLALVRLNDNENDVLKFANGYFACSEGYNFTRMLDLLSIHKCSMNPSNVFYKNIEKIEINCSDIGLNGKYLKDLRLGSWKK